MKKYFGIIKIKWSNIILMMLIQAPLLFSCKKFVSVDPPITRMVTQTVFASDATANGALAGIYSQLRETGFNIALYTGLSSDELKDYTNFQSRVQLYTNSLQASNDDVYTTWSNFYQLIYQCNALLEGATQSSTLSTASKNQLTGEAKFIRAFCYFYLTNLFGNVPLILSTDYQVNAVAARSTEDAVYTQIIKDLNEAENQLGDTYLQSEKTRANKWVAKALLARVYLYKKDFAQAENEATAVINNTSLFNLSSDLNAVFEANSSEAIWQIEPLGQDPVSNTYDGNQFILDGPPVVATLSDGLVNSFEAGDQRKVNWIASYNDGTTSFFYPFKYKIRTGGTPLTEYVMALRLAEQYLIRAEARTESGNSSGALADLNTIRNRAGLPGVSFTSASDLISAIFHERQVELFTEWGHRWLDLKRTGTVDAVMSIVSPLKGDSWVSTQQYYPIPLPDIKTDPNLVQNPGY